MRILPLLLLTVAAYSGACAASDGPGANSASDLAPEAPAGPPADGSLAFPTASDWPSVEPSAAGWNAATLEEASAYAEQSRSTAFIVAVGGKILLERYYGGADASLTRDVASVQKSVMAVLAGVAVDRQLLSLDETVTSVLGAGWSNAPAEAEAAITVRHLLTMTSGLDEKLEYAAPAGTAWLYNNDAYYRVRLVLEQKAGRGIDALAKEWLFDRIGMRDSAFRARRERDTKGLAVVGLQTTARDMARFGLLVLARGSWEGAAIVPAAFLDAAGSTSQPHNEAYGYLFWLNGTGTLRLPPSIATAGPLVPAAPADAVAALGKGDQKIYIVPSERLVVVRQGEAADEDRYALSSFDNALWSRIMAAKVAP